MTSHTRWKARTLALSVVLQCTLAWGAEHHVSPDGRADGQGTAADPWDLKTAFAHPAKVLPGDTLWVHAGTYVGNFESRLRGTAAAPIKVRAEPSARVKLDGGRARFDSGVPTLRVEGAYTWFWGLELMSSSTATREMPTAPGYNTERPELIGIGNNSVVPGIRFINLVLHDGAQGIGYWKGAVDSELYGTLIFNNGFNAPDRGHGHGTYIQNEVGTREIADNILFNQFGEGLNAHGSAAAFVRGLNITGNVVFGNGSPAADKVRDLHATAGSAMQRIVVTHNAVYGIADFGGSYGAVHDDITFGDNLVGGFDAKARLGLHNFRTADIQRNTFIGPNLLIDKLDTTVFASRSGYLWNDNAYRCTEEPNPYGQSQGFYVWEPALLKMFHFAEWRAHTGFDAASTYARTRPAAATVHLRPNKYEPGRANLTLFNWQRRPTVAVNLASVLAPGDAFEVIDVQNYFGPPVLRATFTGAEVAVPMGATEIAQPIGGSTVPVAHTSIEFGAFVVRRTSAAPRPELPPDRRVFIGPRPYWQVPQPPAGPGVEQPAPSGPAPQEPTPGESAAPEPTEVQGVGCSLAPSSPALVLLALAALRRGARAKARGFPARR